MLTTKDKIKFDPRIKPDYRQKEVQRAAEVITRLREKFPTAGCTLKYESRFQMLVTTILLTQSNESAVNWVTSKLFAVYPTAEACMSASRSDIEGLIRPIGFYRQKAKYIIETSRILVEKFHGQVPSTLLEMTQLPGVARKAGNMIIGELYQVAEGIQVDTSIKRVTGRLGLSKGNTASKAEHDLMRIVPQGDWIQFPYLLMSLASFCCYAKRPACHVCPLSDICPSSTAE